MTHAKRRMQARSFKRPPLAPYKTRGDIGRSRCWNNNDFHQCLCFTLPSGQTLIDFARSPSFNSSTVTHGGSRATFQDTEDMGIKCPLGTCFFRGARLL